MIAIVAFGEILDGRHLTSSNGYLNNPVTILKIAFAGGKKLTVTRGYIYCVSGNIDWTIGLSAYPHPVT